jgi:CheY-like chemotaxis protein
MSFETMIVDDALMMRSVISNFVQTMPEFKVVAFAPNGVEALNQLAQHPNLSLILLDIEMPEMDGFEFLRRAKLKTKAKFLVLSSVAVAGSTQAARAKMLGADAIVSKPSGAISFDLAEARGSELGRVMRALVKAPA